MKRAAGACGTFGEEIPRKFHRISSSRTRRTETRGRRDDSYRRQGLQSHTLSIPLGSTQTDSKEHQSQTVRTTAEENPIIAEKFPETLEEGKAAAGGSEMCCEKCAMKVRHLQRSWNKLRIMSNAHGRIESFGFRLVPIRIPGKGRMITNSMHIAKQN